MNIWMERFKLPEELSTVIEHSPSVIVPESKESQPAHGLLPSFCKGVSVYILKLGLIRRKAVGHPHTDHHSV